METILFFYPFISLIFNLFIHISLLRILGPKSQKSSIILGIIAGLIFVVVIHFYSLTNGFSAQPSLPYLIVNVLIYLGLSFCYYTFYNLGVTSLRIRILHEIDHTRGGLSVADIIGEYNEEEMLSKRIERLVSMKQIKNIDGKYLLDKRLLLYLVYGIDLFRWIILGRKTGH